MTGKIILVLALPLLVYAGAKVYLHLQVARSFDQMVEQMAPYADVSYESVTSSFDGRFGIVGLVIRPHAVADKITIDELTAKYPSMFYVLDMEERIAAGELPEEFTLSLLGVAVSVRGPLLQEMEDAMWADDPEGRLASFDNCVTRVNSLPTQQYLLDYDELSLDLEMGYVFDRTSNQFVMHYRVGQHDAVEIAGEFAAPLERFSLAGLQAAYADPKMARARLTVTDLGFFDRLYAYCDREDRIDRKQVVELMTAEYLELFDGLPVEPNEAMVAAYTEFVDGGSQLVVSADPREPRELKFLDLYAPEDIPALLNITTQVIN